MKEEMTKSSHLFLIALIKMSNQKNVKGMIETEIEKRLSDYPFLKDLETRRVECVSERSELNAFQFKPPLGLRAQNKLIKWEKYGDAYLYNYWRNATINYCRAVKKKGEQIVNDAKAKAYDPAEDERVNHAIDQLRKKREYLESLLDPNVHSEAKIQCYLDRLDGMTFSHMMKKYEPLNFSKDEKGQKYYRRFSRFVSNELDIKEEVEEYFKLLASNKNHRQY